MAALRSANNSVAGASQGARPSDSTEQQELNALTVRVLDDGNAWDFVRLGREFCLDSLSWNVPAGLSTISSAAKSPSGSHSTAPSSSSTLSGASGAQVTAQGTMQSTPVVQALEKREVTRSVTVRVLMTGRREEPSNFDSLTATALSVHWYMRPYMSIFVTSYSEVEPYEEPSVRARLKTFVDTCVDRKVEYILLFLYRGANAASRRASQPGAQRRFFASSGSSDADADIKVARKVFEKLRMIANVPRTKERSLFVQTPMTQEDQVEFKGRMRENLSVALDSRIHAYQDEIERVYSTCLLPGWSYFSFFVLKESLAFVYQQAGRYDLALNIYAELLELMSLRGEPGFKEADCLEPGDDGALGLVNPEAKDYRQRVYESSISRLDFHVYVFARQATLYLLKREFTELAHRGLTFIGNATNLFPEKGTDELDIYMNEVFRDAWVFSASKVLASVVESEVRGAEVKNGQLVDESDRRTARQVAGCYVTGLKSFSQLSSLGVHDGAYVKGGAIERRNIPSWSRLAANLAAGDTSGEVRFSSLFTNADLQRALVSLRVSEQMYTELAFTAASLYELSGRARGAAALGGDAGLLRMRYGSLREAEGLLSLQCARFISDQGWDEPHSRSRTALAFIEKSLGKVQEYLLSCLAILIMQRCGGRKSYLQPRESEETRRKVENAVLWFREARDAASYLPKVMKYRLEKLLDAGMYPNVAPWSAGNPGRATVSVYSEIPALLTLDSLAVELRRKRGPDDVPRKEELDANDDAMFLSSLSSDLCVLRNEGPIEVSPGLNSFEVSADSIPSSGRFEVALIVFFLGKLKLVLVADSPEDLMKDRRPKSSLLLDFNKSDTAAGLVQDVPFPAKQDMRGHIEQGLVNRFPRFHSVDRDVLRMSIDQPSLYLGTRALQYLDFEIKTQDFGVEPNAELEIRLEVSEVEKQNVFVAFAVNSDGRHGIMTLQDHSVGSSSMDDFLFVLNKSGDPDAEVNVGRIIFLRGQQSSKTVRLRIAVKVTVLDFVWGRDDFSIGDRHCILTVRSSGICSGEERCNFRNERELELTLQSLFHISAWLSWDRLATIPSSVGSRDHSHFMGIFNLQIRGDVQSRMCNGSSFLDAVVVRRASLKLPPSYMAVETNFDSDIVFPLSVKTLLGGASICFRWQLKDHSALVQQNDHSLEGSREDVESTVVAAKEGRLKAASAEAVILCLETLETESSASITMQYVFPFQASHVSRTAYVEIGLEDCAVTVGQPLLFRFRLSAEWKLKSGSEIWYHVEGVDSIWAKSGKTRGEVGFVPGEDDQDHGNTSEWIEIELVALCVGNHRVPDITFEIRERQLRHDVKDSPLSVLKRGPEFVRVLPEVRFTVGCPRVDQQSRL
ncbi:Trafficking protein particle complex subunit 10 [Porphyridium purpureum]|uniref:Trafficking protein particle complex subunit 10 n=1 Tax=Porphyridium purpureum TaxID=35688 RepID=A0A5J4Z8U5_PORPP|nr:Trafficking protein particle complex subunit 10 [Porphyridium purpureum]|eukprot:POR7338..scf295_1